MTPTGWYAPNQQAVRPDGSGPAEEGSGGSAPSQPAPAAAPSPAAAAGASDLDAMTKDELLTEAERRGVKVDAGMTKAEIREAIGA
jgi:hypothetical protein